MNMNARVVRTLTLSLLIALFAGVGGCELFGWAANGIAGGDPHAPPPLDVKVEYTGLHKHTVAVLVDADQAILFNNPLAQYEVCAAISQRLAGDAKDVRVVNPRQVVDYQNRNIYWNTARYSDLAKKLGADRLVIVDLLDYRFHEPGNVNIWRAVASANVGVAETDGAHPDDLAYSSTVAVAYPPDKPQGIIESNLRTMKLATLDLLSRSVVGRFVKPPKDADKDKD